VILYPSAKINIGLNIVEKRSDGYHELETIMIPVPLFDIVEIIPQENFEWKQSGLLIDGNDENNLCIKAFHLIQTKYGIGNVYMHLRKQIPMGAGLGGGSADAAYIIKGLNELFQLNISTETQQELSAQLGSDCPFFIQQSTQLATGRGEILKPIDFELTDYYLVLIKPDIHINTAQAYSGVYISGDKGKLEQNIHLLISEWKNCIKNDFEQHIFKLHPQLETIKNSFYENGALYASMSGSGSTMYGIFKEKPDSDFNTVHPIIYNGKFGF
jgi:4-diphosphocytidyl-2-C-methyl-D-erythritol kinase